MTWPDITARAARAAYEQAGLGPADLDLVELHDAFAIAELLHAEALGIADRGAAHKAVTSGEFDRDGRVAVSPSGGLLSRGHPLGATGVSQLGRGALAAHRRGRGAAGAGRAGGAHAHHRRWHLRRRQRRLLRAHPDRGGLSHAHRPALPAPRPRSPRPSPSCCAPTAGPSCPLRTARWTRWSSTPACSTTRRCGTPPASCSTWSRAPRSRAATTAARAVVVVGSRDQLGWGERPEHAAEAAAVFGAARSLALRLAPRGITVNVVAGLPAGDGPAALLPEPATAGRPRGHHRLPRPSPQPLRHRPARVLRRRRRAAVQPLRLIATSATSPIPRPAPRRTRRDHPHKEHKCH